MSMDAETVKELLAIGARLTAIDHPGGGQAVLAPQGYKFEHLRDPAQKPFYTTACPVFTDLEGFVDYINAFKTEGTRLWGSESQVVAVLDWPTRESTDHGAHRAIFDIPYSEDYTRWFGVHNKLMPQVEFAEFVQENRVNIAAPDAAAVLEIVTELQASSRLEFSSAVNLRNGSQRLVWGEEQQTKGKSELEVPETLGLRMPIFDRGDVWAMNAWLRTRIKDGKLYFLVKLDRPDVIVKAALEKLRADIRQRTELLVAPGQP